MSIPTQFPPLTLAIKPSTLQALVLQAGQTLQAVIISTAANGMTQVQIGQQRLNVSLPSPMPAGTTLNLQAQGSGAQQKLVLLPQTVVTQTPLPVAMRTQIPVQPPQPVVLPTRPGALQPLALQPGQALEARVLGPVRNGATQVQIGGQTIEVTLPQPMPKNTVLPLVVRGIGAQQQLVLQPRPVQAAIPAPSSPVAPQPAALPSAVQPAVPLSSSPHWTPTPAAQQPGPIKTPTPTAAAPPPNAPQVALTQMMQQAVQQQDSHANLSTVLAAVIGKVALPPPVQQAAEQVLAASLPLNGPALNGNAIQKAVVSSGIFQEAMLATQAAPQLAQGDLKTALLVLRNTLVSWVGQAAAVTVPPGPLPPPMRGALPRARHGTKEQLEIPLAPNEVGKVMLERTESSLARLRLHQHASLPEHASPAAKADWSMDLPVVIGTYQAVMQMHIQRDEAGPEQSSSERGWQIRFAMDLPALGEVGAQVGLRGGTTSVRLWATNPETADKFAEGLPELALALQLAGLRPGIIAIRPDEPPTTPPVAGHFVDSVI